MKIVVFPAAIFIFLMASAFAQTATVELAWDPLNPVPGKQINYTIHFGTASGIYTGSLNVGTNPTGKISGLSKEATYYFAVSAAFADGGSRSEYSNEVSSKYEPPSAPVKPPPYSIDGSTLKIAKDGAVTFDVTGIPGGYCEIETSTDLKTWFPLTELMFDAGNITERIYIQAPANKKPLPRQFFRAKWTDDPPTN